MRRCEVCGLNPATVPDRRRPGRRINRLCESCHAQRLAGDLEVIARRQAIRLRREREQTERQQSPDPERLCEG